MTRHRRLLAAQVLLLKWVWSGWGGRPAEQPQQTHGVIPAASLTCSRTATAHAAAPPRSSPAQGSQVTGANREEKQEAEGKRLIYTFLLESNHQF